MKKAIPRVIPCLLLRNQGFVKTKRFRDPRYLGDPLNILRIFNEKEADEILILDTLATLQATDPQKKYLADLASECFMPAGYGGGIHSVEEAEAVLGLGYEKVCLNTAAIEKPQLIRDIAVRFGSQSVVVAIDCRRGFFGRYEAYTRAGTRASGLSPVEVARRSEDLGAGEILVTSIDREGMREGYDLSLTRAVAESVKIPVIAHGGAGCVADLVRGVSEGCASAVAAGSLFVFQGRHQAVLINMPTYRELQEAFHGARPQ